MRRLQNKHRIGRTRRDNGLLHRDAGLITVCYADRHNIVHDSIKARLQGCVRLQVPGLGSG